jgi:hypothetical protein
VQRRRQEGMSISKQRQHFSKQFYEQCPGNTRGKKLQQDDDGFAPPYGKFKSVLGGYMDGTLRHID